MNDLHVYKSISLEIVKALESSNLGLLDDLFNKRQSILDNLVDEKILKDNSIKSEILDIDNKIKDLLAIEIEKTKHEIKEHKRSMAVNNSYLQNNRENLNIFNKKV